MCSVSLQQVFGLWAFIYLFIFLPFKIFDYFLPPRCEFQVVEMSCFALLNLLNMQWRKPRQAGAPAKVEDETVSWETKVKERGNEREAFPTIAKIQISGDLEILHEHQFRMPIVWVVLGCLGLAVPPASEWGEHHGKAGSSIIESAPAHGRAENLPG